MPEPFPAEALEYRGLYTGYRLIKVLLYLAPVCYGALYFWGLGTRCLVSHTYGDRKECLRQGVFYLWGLGTRCLVGHTYGDRKECLMQPVFTHFHAY